jgi:hypothetical protein
MKTHIFGGNKELENTIRDLLRSKINCITTQGCLKNETDRLLRELILTSPHRDNEKEFH